MEWIVLFVSLLSLLLWGWATLTPSKPPREDDNKQLVGLLQ